MVIADDLLQPKEGWRNIVLCHLMSFPTNFNTANGGDITINSQELILENTDNTGISDISSVINQGGKGNSGNITINSSTLQISDGSIISTVFDEDESSVPCRMVLILNTRKW